MSKRRARLSPEAEAIHFIISGSDKPCYKVKWINDYKGRGVFASAPIEKGSFVLEYRGEFISQYEWDKRQGKYTEKQNAFLFDFEWNNGSWCIDASCEDGSLGRLWPWRALTPSDKIPAQASADPETPSDKIQLNLQQTQKHTSDKIPAQPSADPEVRQRSTSSFQQTPSDKIPAQPSADPEVRQRSTSSFQQTPTDKIPAQPSADPEVRQRSTSSFQQASKSSGIVPFQCPTAKQTLMNLRMLQTIFQTHVAIPRMLLL
ncbi:hypothetical protein J4Q44_G00388670 [Coregonus suidteri]|uniref:SET domain-containing protein n=1 Tax=Coregonus suidteri TaxID=861788 RepID=A0AAN8Q3X0_9TELE